MPRPVGDEDAAEVCVEPQLEILEVCFGRERRDVELLQGLGDAFCLSAGKAALLQLLDDAVRVDHETGTSQGEVSGSPGAWRAGQGRE